MDGWEAGPTQPGSKITFKEALVVYPAAFIFVLVGLAVIQIINEVTFAGVRGVKNILFYKIADLPFYVVLLIGIGCIVAMIIVWALRDVKNWASIAALQIFVSAVICVGTVLSGLNSALPVVTLIGGIYTGANGVKRLVEILDAKARTSAQ